MVRGVWFVAYVMFRSLSDFVRLDGDQLCWPAADDALLGDGELVCVGSVILFCCRSYRTYSILVCLDPVCVSRVSSYIVSISPVVVGYLRALNTFE